MQKNDNTFIPEENRPVVYDCANGTFAYPPTIQTLFGVQFEGTPIWQVLVENGIASPDTADAFHQTIDAIAASDVPQAVFENCLLQTADGAWKNYRVGFICAEPGGKIAVSFTKENNPGATLRDASEGARDYEIIIAARQSLEEGRFCVHLQPQYNHATGMIVGAEALARWNHPEHGLIGPDYFIPVLERHNCITELDFYIFEQACICLRHSLDACVAPVSISVNFSRQDIFRSDFVERLNSIREKYDVPVKYLRIEITESAMAGGSRQSSEVVNKLHSSGYIVAMDDFGSGYSSLNVLKDIEVDVLKLDMLFLSENPESSRGGTILNSIVRMAKWLSLPVIAEGVETIAQADFLRSIGCDYIQGYLYSRPLPMQEFEALLASSTVGSATPKMKLIDTLDAGKFWSPESQETLIFSNYVGGASIFALYGENIELMRINQKYLQELGMNLSEKELIQRDPMAVFDETNRRIYLDMLDRAIRTGEEQECETWRSLSSSCCGEEKICIRSTVRMIGKSEVGHLFYGMVRNITAEKRRFNEILDSERRFKAASEQVNIYYWEYTIATREMRPCYRCMRDLGLPALLTNYPDSAIEMGVFPPEVADMYRDWHRRIAEGEKSLEAVIPLTVGRVPFHVRYTTEFDENGRPIKAYGSAALVVK